ncbi:MAG TPA: hypothetical protein VD905_04805 [Flavobacteriales bacterium]|nr:hypothetical protein [Flavobacteriales bacterium]
MKRNKITVAVLFMGVLIGTTGTANAQLKNLKNISLSRYKLPNDEDDGVKGDIHSKYVDKIVFAKEEITKNNPVEASFTNTFTLADNIYSRIFLKQSQSNFANNVGHIWSGSDFFYRIKIEGEPVNDLLLNDFTSAGDKESITKWTTLQLGISPAPQQMSEYNQASISILFEHFYHLPEGSYKVKLDFIFDVPADQEKTSATIGEPKKTTSKFGPEIVMASGEFTLNVQNSDKLAYAKKVCNPLPEPTMTDKELEQSMLKAVAGKWEGQTPVKAVIIGDDWIYLRDEWGTITGRKIEAAVVIKFEKQNMYKVFDMSFYQQNQGGEKYGITKYNGEMNGGKVGQWWIAEELIR